MSLNQKILCASVLLALSGASQAAEHPAVARALAMLQAHGAQTLVSSNDRFQSRDVIVDSDGSEHVRFDRSYGGLPVIGGDVVLHTRGQTSSVSLTQKAPLRVSLRPSLSAADAIVAAGGEFGSDFRGLPQAALVIYRSEEHTS